jgi:16S rRNA (cytosine1402-N4)-methyltransferase
MSQENQENERIHIPVLLDAVLQQLQPAKGQSYLDLTSGYGGHAGSVLDLTKAANKAVLVDRDEQAISSLKSQFGEHARIIHQDFLSASQQLAEQGEKFDMILADLGASSLHLDEASRGFSFANPGPLDMRMDIRQELTAEQLVNKSTQAQLSTILRDYGQEHKAHTIARKIIQNRPIESTEQLAKVISGAIGWRGRHSKVHPATKSFQALRIAVNDELEQIRQSLPLWASLLAPGGRLAVISFHSLEDRLVKQYFTEIAANTYDSEFTNLTKKPVVASQNEIVLNPRARSAKLRAVAKIKTT